MCPRSLTHVYSSNIRHWEGSVKWLGYYEILWEVVGDIMRSYVNFYVGAWEISAGLLIFSRSCDRITSKILIRTGDFLRSQIISYKNLMISQGIRT